MYFYLFKKATCLVKNCDPTTTTQIKTLLPTTKQETSTVFRTFTSQATTLMANLSQTNVKTSCSYGFSGDNCEDGRKLISIIFSNVRQL